MIKFNALYLLIFMLFFSCGKTINKESKEEKKEEASKSAVEIYNYNTLKPLLHKESNKTYVINFWATWCKPCVEELPVFEKLHADYKDKNIEVILVSLDFQVEDQLIPFIKNNKIASKVVVLDDPDQNTWIPDIDKTWSGALPATLIYNKNKRAFYEQSFDEELLLKEVQKFIN